MQNKAIWNTWMLAHARAAMDSQTDLRGNSHDAWTVQETIYFCMAALGISADYGVTPTREEIIAWMNENNMANEVEYLMEEY